MTVRHCCCNQSSSSVLFKVVEAWRARWRYRDAQDCNSGIHVTTQNACLRLRHPAMRIRLTRRLAEHLNGVDLSRRAVGDLFDLPPHDAEMLIAEGWALAVPVTREGDSRHRHADAANDGS